jgi:hypothetical protein
MSRRARRPSPRDVRPRADRVDLNDLFKLFPPLPGFRHRRVADQLRRMRENVERMQQRARSSVASHQAAAAWIRAAWLAKRRG